MDSITPVYVNLISFNSSDPTLRLDLAPSLNWLTRRSITAAVQQGQLRIEPMQSSQAATEFAAHLGPAQPREICCALCGKAVMPYMDQAQPPPSHPLTAGRTALQNPAAAWASTSRFFRTSLSSVGSGSLSRPSTANSTPAPTSPSTPSQFIYIFRLSLPAPQRSQPYALCPSGWCLARMRATCEMWRFLRTNVVEKVWEEESPVFAAHKANHNALDNSSAMPSSTPPRPISRRTSSTRMASLWDKGWTALGGDPNGSSASGVMSRSKTEPSPLSPTSEKPAVNPSEIKGPSPPPRRVLPPPLPDRNASRPNVTTSPKEEATDLSKEEDSFATPRTSLDDRPLPAAVSLNDDQGPQSAAITEGPRKSIEDTIGTPRLKNLPTSAPSTPPLKQDTLPTAAALVAGASPAPPPVPRRAAARRAPLLPARVGSPSPRTSLVIEKERETEVNGKRDSIVQAEAAGPSTEIANNSRPATPTLSNPAAPEEAITEKPQPSETLASDPHMPSADALRRSLDVSSAVAMSSAPPVPHRDPNPPSNALALEPLPSAGESISSEHGEENPYVGEKTWEDKAWRELSRLRLEMFWARIGASGSQRE